MKPLKEKALLIKLSMGCWNSQKSDKKVTEQVCEQHSASRNSGKFVKELVPRRTMENVQKLMTDTRANFYKRTLPWKDEGWRIVPSASCMDLIDELRRAKSKIQIAVDEFIGEFSEYVQQAKAGLGGMFNEKDYPTATELKGKFFVEISFAPIPDQEDFRMQTDEEIKQSVESQVKEAELQASKDIWSRMHTPLARMVERLSKDDNKFKDSLVENINEIVDLIPSLDITDDPNIERFRNELKALTKHTAQDLRDDKNVRKETAEKANQIMNRMKEFMI